ncbi:MAG TPA: ATP-binding protein, partial [Aquaticitalea sp.]|nr:ATP-binding protein [Aquaticitalea sp.]
SGMGLGLGMVKNIVETYNGSIYFISEAGKETVFTVTFPKSI